MIKKINTKTIKLIKFYNFINYKLIYNNNAINRYKKDNFEISENKAKNLDLLKKSIINLRNCDLKKHAKNIVFSDGNPKSQIMLVGEAPGANEDQEGLPFVGRAGQLLDKMLSAIDLDRKKVYISNIINYRPPENRRPTDDEIKRYQPFIRKHIEIIKPKILVLLGSTAMNAMIRTLLSQGLILNSSDQTFPNLHQLMFGRGSFSNWRLAGCLRRRKLESMNLLMKS